MSRVANRLLDSLPPTYRKALVSQMETVTLAVSAPLYEPGEPPAYAHFLTSGVVSVVDFMEDGEAVEVALVGREGLTEAVHLLGKAQAPTRAFVQVGGTALRIPFVDLQEQFLNYEPLRSVILAYVQTRTFAVDQLAACNRLHEVEPRIARWLLLMMDRVGEKTFPLTQEFLAEMIGTRRTTVTLAAQHLQETGAIQYSRGKMRILNRRTLENAACECYAIMRKLS